MNATKKFRTCKTFEKVSILFIYYFKAKGKYENQQILKVFFLLFPPFYFFVFVTFTTTPMLLHFEENVK